ncbi:Protein SOSEKI 1 [Exophiala xenobiotica]|uniref:Protein SOSEKI 1 n=1 Tax=Lithohypha guttulata TaxID=1690604 RepID=A0ABR0JUU9_9EURO|nr:Protein SOSEKI 1 [Lithohypha guttulata]KAK5309400.1 Protein SOSEKI 1 [Exophiala xenobiotica]
MQELGDGGELSDSDAYQSATSHVLNSNSNKNASDSSDVAMYLENVFSSISRPVEKWPQHETCLSTSASTTKLRRRASNGVLEQGSSADAAHVKIDKRHDKFAHHARVVHESTQARVHVAPCLLKSNRRLHRLLASVYSGGARLLDDMDEVELSALASPVVVAPVTKDSLKELELPAIQNNLALRIDLCFDHELFFQRISGTKGEEKQKKATIFWEVLSLELQAYAHALHHPRSEGCPDCRNAQMQGLSIDSRLVAFFSAFRELLEMLVPDSDKRDVLQRVNVDWLTKQVRIGLFDATAFFNWLLKLLMSHCAPMRDESAREMHKKITRGADLNDMNLLVDGLEALMSLLENMKLDVANHQVRSFKLLLIADTLQELVQ